MQSNNTKEISGGSLVDSYPNSSDDRLRFAIVKLIGRYPKTGVAVNEKQTEGIIVVKGQAEVQVCGEKTICKEGDVVYFEEGKEYVVSGKATIVVAIAPAKGGKTDIKK